MRYVLTVCLLLSLGCSDDDSGGNGGNGGGDVKNIAGTWSGTFIDAPPLEETGTIILILTQDTLNIVTGTMSFIEGNLTANGTILNGRVNGSGFTSTWDTGFCTWDLDFFISDNEMTIVGDYTFIVETPQCPVGQSGTITVTKN